MKTETKEFKVFTYEELSEQAKEKARQIIGEQNTNDSYWYEYLTDEYDANEYFEVEKVYFSGFWSQGDGAMFEYSRITDKLVNEAIDSMNMPTWKKDVLKGLGFVGKGKHSGHYYHENSCEHYIECNTTFNDARLPRLYKFYSDALEYIEDFIVSKYIDLCSELYRALEEQYEYNYSEECVVDCIESNGYEFNEDGTIY